VLFVSAVVIDAVGNLIPVFAVAGVTTKSAFVPKNPVAPKLGVVAPSATQGAKAV